MKLTICPKCESDNQFQELSYRATWQPVTLSTEGEPVAYESFDYSDEVWVNGVGCLNCGAVWPSYDDLHKAMRGEAHRTGYLPDAEVFPKEEA